MPSNFYLDNEDLRFQVEQAFDWPELVALYERDFTDPEGFGSVDEALEFYREVLEIVGKFVADEVAPVARELDRHHPRLVDGEVVEADEARKIFDGLRELAERFLDRAAPVVNWMHDEIHHTGDSVLEQLAARHGEDKPPRAE